MLITVYKDGEEMQANSNPDGLKLLAKCGWSVEPEVELEAEPEVVLDSVEIPKDPEAEPEPKAEPEVAPVEILDEAEPAPKSKSKPKSKPKK
jgi:hypothetical protein